MLSLEIRINGTLVTTAGVADAEKIEALVALYPGIQESWVCVSGDVVPDDNAPADASWFHRGLSQGDTVTIRLVDSVAPSAPNLTRSDPSVESTDAIPFACSFCGKPNTEIESMWAGRKAQICNECIQLMHKMSLERSAGPDKAQD